MSKTFRIILTIASLLAFILLFICIEAESKTEESIIIAIILIFAAIGAMRIIWNNNEKPKI